MYVGIVGSRRRCSLSDSLLVRQILEHCVQKFKGQEIVVVSGGCPRGADRFAEEHALSLGLSTLIHPIWTKGETPYGGRGEFTRRAHARNALIARDSDIVFALVHSDRKGGTENTVGHALRLGKTVFVVDDRGLFYLETGVREASEEVDSTRVAPGAVFAAGPEDDASKV